MRYYIMTMMKILQSFDDEKYNYNYNHNNNNIEMKVIKNNIIKENDKNNDNNYRKSTN